MSTLRLAEVKLVPLPAEAAREYRRAWDVLLGGDSETGPDVDKERTEDRDASGDLPQGLDG